MFRGHSDMTEAIQRELEKERIREEIIAQEMVRRSVLEMEVRRELMMEQEMMAMSNRGGSFMPLSLPPSHNNMFEIRMLHRLLIEQEERIAMMSLEKYGVGGHGCDIRGFGAVPFQQFSDSSKMKGIPTPVSEDTKKKVIVLAKPNAPTVAAGSSEPHSDSSKKKLEEEWSCAICQVTTTTERTFNEHLQGKKHQAKEAALIAEKTGANVGLGVAPKKPTVKPTLTVYPDKKKVKNSSKIESNDPKNEEQKRDKFKFWCEMCEVGTSCENTMNTHKEGKKHLRRKAMAETITVEEEEEDEVKTVNEAIKNLADDMIKIGVLLKSKVLVSVRGEQKARDRKSRTVPGPIQSQKNPAWKSPSPGQSQAHPVLFFSQKTGPSPVLFKGRSRDGNGAGFERGPASPNPHRADMG